jgi:hypothetical protein
MLTSKCLKGVNVGYPLGIVVSKHHVKDLKMLGCMSEAFYVREVGKVVRLN